MMAGLKHDEGKLDWHALPLELVELLVPVAVNGANKYGRHSILKTIEDAGPRHYSATMRHLSACQLDPLAIDPESGCYHAVHAAYDLLARVYQCAGLLASAREEHADFLAKLPEQRARLVAERNGYTVPPLDDGDDDQEGRTVKDHLTVEPRQAASSKQEAYEREQVATSAQAKDTARDAMATSAQRRGAMDDLAPACGYAIPQRQDGTDGPAVHIVPYKTSRSTLPSGCLSRLCGRGDYDGWQTCPND